MIRSNRDYETLLTSWTSPLLNKADIDNLLSDGEEYIRKINNAVKENYTNEKDDFLNCCKKTVEKLGLPQFVVNPVVNRAFLSHLT
jgi:hypothetical protein